MIGILIFTVIAFVCGTILVFADEKLNKKQNKVKQFLKRLPGYNCGACGFGSCEGMAEAMKEEIDNYKKCKPLRGELLKEMEVYVEKWKQKEEKK